MPRAPSVASLALTLIGASLAAQPPADLPVAEGVKFPQALTSAELRFSATGDKLLIVRRYGDGATPLVTIHDVRPEPKQGRGVYFPLVYPDLYGSGNVSVGFRRADLSTALSPDGNILAASSFKLVRMWDIGKEGHFGWWPPKPVSLNLPGSAMSAFTKDGKRLVTASLIGGEKLREKAQVEVRLWEAGSGKGIGEPGVATVSEQIGPRPTLKNLTFAPDGSYFLTAAGSAKSEAGSAHLWDAKTLKPLGEPIPIAGDFYHIAPEGKTLLAVSKKEIAVWSITDRKPICTLPTPEVAKNWALGQYNAKSMPWFAAHPSGTSVLCRDEDQARLWDLSGTKPVEKLTLKHSGSVYWTVISPDGKKAATASENPGEVFVWSLETGKPLLKIPHEGTVKAMEFSPDGKLLATVSPGDVHLWKLEAKK